MPERIWRRRTKGWRMPPNTVSVTRGKGVAGRFGNPFTVKQRRELNAQGDDEQLARACVSAFRRWLTSDMSFDWIGPESERARKALMDGLPELCGKNLACWCKPGQPCHADVLLELANPAPQPRKINISPEFEAATKRRHGGWERKR